MIDIQGPTPPGFPYGARLSGPSVIGDPLLPFVFCLLSMGIHGRGQEMTDAQQHWQQ